MTQQQRLLEKLRRIEALLERPGTEGERMAASHARDRILQCIGTVPKQEPLIEMRFSVSDEWSRRLLLAVLEANGIKAFRRSGQKRSSIMARMPQRLADDVVWPEFQELQRVMAEHFDGYVQTVVGRMGKGRGQAAR